MSSTRYQHLLSPLKVGRTYLKNRLVSCTSMPHYIQGNERFPADSMIEHVIRRAKGGAGIVTFTGFDDPDNVPPAEDIVHFPIINQYDTRCQNYVSQLVECLHYYDATACISSRVMRRLCMGGESGGIRKGGTSQSSTSTPRGGAAIRAMEALAS